MTEKNFAALTLPFGDNEYSFQLQFQAVSDWEKQHDRSLFETFNRMVETRHARLTDVRSIVHMALIGGGMSAPDALVMVKRFVEDRPLGETQPVALAVMESFFFGSDEYRAAKGEGDGEE